MPTDKLNILGVGVSPINMQDALGTIEGWIEKEERQYVCVTGVHGIMESQRDEELLLIHNRAGLVTPDGMPLVWIGRIHGFSRMERVYGPDLMLALCRRSVTKGYRHYLFGGAEGVPERLAGLLEAKFPGLNIVGTHSPPFGELASSENAQMLRQINDTQPDVIWVGLSTPKQERWMAQHVGKLNAALLIGVGAAFDFHAGVKKQAPRWMQRSGLEWSFRLATEPRRLWRRYLVNVPLFMSLVLVQSLGMRRYQIRV